MTILKRESRKNVTMVEDTALEDKLMSKYLVTTVQLNALVNKTLLRNMLVFADRHDIHKIYVFVMPGRHKDETILPHLEDERFEFLFLGKEGMKLNNNLKLFDTQVLASQINPLTGFNSKLHRNYSYILPSPKIRYQSIPNTSKYPRFLATTGALTHGNYKEHIAQGRKASVEHQYGFAYVEIRNNTIFDYVPIEAMKNGNFHYLREYYKNGKVHDAQPEALVLGDWHQGHTCKKVRKRTFEMIAELQPKRVVLHDFFDGYSVNHHERYDNMARAIQHQRKQQELEEEMNELYKEMVAFANHAPETQFLVAESNHDLRLFTYINKENFLQDGHNSVFACKLFVAVYENPDRPILETALSLIGDLPGNFRFLSEDEEYRVKGVGLDYHGHRGVNGARGTSPSFDRNNLKLITAHEHSPKIYANGMVVGTSTELRQDYTKGAGSWLNAHGVLYSSGKYSLLTLLL